MAGQIDINLKKRPTDKELWDRTRKDVNAVAQEICQVIGTHTDEYGDDLILELDDIIVKSCVWHFGKKDKNPLSFVRFIHREDIKSQRDFKTYEMDEEDCPTDIAAGDQKMCIRVFCRDPDPAKQGLLEHKFKQWSENRNTSVRQTSSGGLEVLEEASAGEDENVGNNFRRGAVQLTQESGDEGEPLSPMRSPGSRRDDQSPIHLPDFASL
jgi:hypothetical protein